MSDQQISSKAPWHLWVVGGLLLIWQGMAAFDYMATLIRYEPYLAGYPEDILNYYFNAPAWMYLMWGVASIGGLVAALFLLLRRKLAVPLFALGWLSSLVAAIYTFQNPPPVLGEGEGGGVMFYAIVLAAALMVLLYLVWLSRKGVLR